MAVFWLRIASKPQKINNKKSKKVISRRTHLLVIDKNIMLKEPAV